MALLAAIISGLCFTLLGILLKRNAVADGNPLVLPSWLGLLFPVWAALFVGTQMAGAIDFNLTAEALVWPMMWAMCTITTTTLLVWLLQSLSLTEVAGYKKALLTVLASGADIFVFQTAFPIAMMVAVGLILLGSIGLGQAKHRLPTPMQAAAIIGWCFILTLQVSAYKQGQLYQSHVMAHTIIAQGFSTFGYSLLWLLPAINKNPLPSLKAGGPILAVAFIGVMVEGFAYAALPLAVVIIVTMSGAALFAVHDLWRRDLPRNWKTYAALGAIASGFLLLVTAKYL